MLQRSWGSECPCRPRIMSDKASGTPDSANCSFSVSGGTVPWLTGVCTCRFTFAFCLSWNLIFVLVILSTCNGNIGPGWHGLFKPVALVCSRMSLSVNNMWGEYLKESNKGTYKAFHLHFTADWAVIYHRKKHVLSPVIVAVLRKRRWYATPPERVCVRRKRFSILEFTWMPDEKQPR